MGHSNMIINLKSNSITILTIYMLTASLYVAFFNSYAIQIFILLSILGILIMNEIIHQGSFFLKKTDVFFIISIFAVIGSLHDITLITSEIADPIILCLGIIISIFIRGNIDNYDYSFKLIKWASIFYALSVILSYLLPNLYYTIFLSQLRPIFADNILTLMEKGYYTGFTGQVAYTAGYIVFGLGLICCKWIINRKWPSKKEILFILILILGLLISQKRAHLLILFLSLIIVNVQFSSHFLIRVGKILRNLLLIIIIVIPTVLLIGLTDFGQILFARSIETIKDFSMGEDITSNRIFLWLHAWETFLQNPILGIGWGNFKETVIGTVTVHTEMEAHNIYLQLLSETGIVGTVSILAPFFITYLYTIKTTRRISRNNDMYSSKWKFSVLYSFFIQTFFLLYGITGNPLYDYSFLIMYFLSFGMIYSFWQCNKQAIKENNKK